MWISSKEKLSNNEIQNSLKLLFSTVHTGAIGVGGNFPWTFTAYLAMQKNKLWFTSQDTTRHTKQIRANGHVAVCLWQAPTEWGDSLFGIQLKGHAEEVTTGQGAKEGLSAMHNRFPGTIQTLPDTSAVIGADRRTCLFVITCESGSLRDEHRLEKGRHSIEWKLDE